MSYEIEGKVIVKGDIEDVSDKFRKREFVIEKSETNNGNTFTEYIKLQLTQKNCGQIDAVSVGDSVKVKFNIKGTKWQKDGKTNYFTNLDAWKVDIVDELTGQSNAEGASKRVNPVAEAGLEEATDEDFFGDNDEVKDDLPF